MKISLKNIIVPTIPLAVFSVGCCVVLWMSAFIGARYATISSESTTASQALQFFFLPNTLLSNIISAGFTLLNAFLLAQLNNRFTIIRTRTFLPILIFMLLMSSWNETHLMNGSHFALTLFIFSLFYFLNMYRDTKAVEQAFMGSFLISAASLIITPLIFLIPVCWLGFILVQSFSLRTLLASLFGALAPWILYISVIFYFQPDIDLVQFFTTEFGYEFSLPILSASNIIYTSALIVILLISLGGMYSNFHNETIRTRTKLNFILFLLIAVSVITALHISQFAVFLPIIAFGYSLLISNSFTLRLNNFNGILFIIFCLLNLAFVISKYIFY